MKSKGTKERYTHLNVDFQRIARRDKKAFLRGQCKEIEENNRMGKTRDLFKKIRDTKGTFLEPIIQSEVSQKEKHIIHLIPDTPIHRHTLEISQVPFQTATAKHTLQKSKARELCGFPAHTNGTFTLHRSPVSVQWRYV